MKNQQWTTSNTIRIISSVRNSRFTKGLVLGAFLFGSFLAQSQTLAEFKYSSEQSEGRKIIPYSDLQALAKTEHDDQDRATAAIAGYNSAKLLSDKKLYIGFRADVNRNLNESKKKLSDYKGTDASKKAELKKKVETDEADVKEVEAKLKDLDSKMTAGLPKWEAVAEARKNVRKVFSNAYLRLEDSEDHPEKHIKKPASTDKAGLAQWEKDSDLLKQYIANIKGKIKDGYVDHDREIKVATDAVEKLKEGLAL